MRHRPRRLVYDPDSDVGVPLACVEICDLADRKARCEPRYGFCPRPPRRLRGRARSSTATRCSTSWPAGCDVALPRVQSISWQDWIDRGWRERIPWAEFAERIAAGLEIRFTRPIRIPTIHHASIFLAALTQEENSDYWVSRKLPMRFAAIDEDGHQCGASGSSRTRTGSTPR